MPMSRCSRLLTAPYLTINWEVTGLVGCGGIHTYVVVVTARNPRRRQNGSAVVRGVDLQVLDAACGSALSTGSEQRPVDPAAAPLRQCRAAQQAGEAVSSWLEESQPGRRDNVTADFRGHYGDVIRGSCAAADRRARRSRPVLRAGREVMTAIRDFTATDTADLI
jgi:hypothetical protein